MDIYECERAAQNASGDTQFYVQFPAGRFRCTWLDPFMGLIRVHAPGMENGFIQVNTLLEIVPSAVCEDFGPVAED